MLSEISQIPINRNELSRHDNELEKFKAKYSEKHVEIKMLVSGYKLVSDNGEATILEPFSLIKVFLEEEEGSKFSTIYRKIEILESSLTYAMDAPKDHVIRVSAGSGTLFPIERSYKFDSYMTSFIAMQKRDHKEDWKNKREDFFKISDYLFEQEEKAIPLIWYKKGVLANDVTSTFLNFYRCIEVLARINMEKTDENIRKAIRESMDIENKSGEIRKRCSSVGIPKNVRIPYYLEDKGIGKETYDKWRWYRNKLTHGDYENISFEFDEEFRKEMKNLGMTTRNLLSDYIDQHIS